MLKRKTLLVVVALLVFCFCTAGQWMEKMAFAPGREKEVKSPSVDIELREFAKVRSYGLDTRIKKQLTQDMKYFLHENTIVRESPLCREIFVGCFFPIEGLDILKNPTTALKTSGSFLKTCSTASKWFTAVVDQGKSKICGSSIKKEYVQRAGMLRSTKEKFCLKSPGLIPVYRISDECVQDPDDKTPIGTTCLSDIRLGRSFSVDMMTQQQFNMTVCKAICARQGFLLAGYSFEFCYCTNWTKRIMESTKCNSYERIVNLTRSGAIDSKCTSRRFLPPNSAPLVGLISFPGSGNTWLRHLVEHATGIYTGSIYTAQEIYEQGLLGEYLPWNSGQTIMIKSHQCYYDKDYNYDKIVLAIRNPYKAIVAEYNRLHGGQTGYAPASTFVGNEWEHFVSYKIEKWSNTTFTYVRRQTPLLITYYEDLLANPGKELRRIIDWLGVIVPNLDARLECTLNNLSGKVHRKQRNLPFDIYSKSMINLVNDHIAKSKAFLRKSQHKPLPNYEKFA